MLLPADKYDPDTLMSFQEWKDCGRFVLKGSKSRCRDAVGVPQFSVDQVTEPEEDDLPTYETQNSGRSHLGQLRDIFDVDGELQFKHHSVDQIMGYYGGVEEDY